MPATNALANALALQRKLSPQTRHNMLIARLLITYADLAMSEELEIRLHLLLALSAAHTVEVKRGQGGSYLYDVNRQLNLAVAIRDEEISLNARLPIVTASQAILIRSVMAAVAITQDLKFPKKEQA
jgi:hypothetical protein